MKMALTVVVLLTSFLRRHKRMVTAAEKFMFHRITLRIYVHIPALTYIGTKAKPHLEVSRRVESNSEFNHDISHAQSAMHKL